VTAERRPVVMPSVEVGMEEGRLIEFLVDVGSSVSVGQPLFVVEAEKVTLEIEAPAAGRVAELCVEPDTDVRVGSPVLVLDVA
jgi:pyruvate/2-oxoglutarate dehydrogenase complex dihydrolipoamide acyltransferase (E2) component